ncbi:LOW QUALITY PROTEIN: probable polygalacturonase [Asparagus officinalis]|uniref:LOW QUALITY PROTEIN: probable polygalacturonase n=1 Tax=Asparagus officinalis TaxID=4686 RepID=UPI00098E5D8D|nr:LOW QUALITY PROTEIN: probable polygalacturonase [Asparagus officinalis]
MIETYLGRGGDSGSFPMAMFLLWALTFASAFYWRPSWRPNYARVRVGILKLVPLPRANFDLKEFGGVGDGMTDNTEAFEAAVAAIREERGMGQLERWQRGLTGAFNLTSHMTLFLDKDAVILGNTDEEKWQLMPPLPSYGVGREHDGPRFGSLIHGQNLQDVVITGNNGTIDGQGQVWWTRFKQRALNNTRGPLVQFMWSRDIVISNITLRNSPFWNLHPYDCKNVTVSNVTILAPVTAAPNTDGIDPDSCEDMLIENCYIAVGDDGIAIKSGWDQYGIRYGRPSSNIVIRNLTLRSTVSAGISIGSEMSGGVENVTVENIHVWDSRRAIRIKTAPGRGGYIRNITYNNVTIDNTMHGIVLVTDYNQHPDEEYDRAAIPNVENLSFTGIYGKDVRIPVQILGSEDIPIRGVSFRNVTMKLHKKKDNVFQCAYVEGRVFGSIFPAPCKNLDRYDDNGQLVMKSTSHNVSLIDYAL